MNSDRTAGPWPAKQPTFKERGPSNLGKIG